MCITLPFPAKLLASLPVCCKAQGSPPQAGDLAISCGFNNLMGCCFWQCPWMWVGRFFFFLSCLYSKTIYCPLYNKTSIHRLTLPYMRLNVLLLKEWGAFKGSLWTPWTLVTTSGFTFVICSWPLGQSWILNFRFSQFCSVLFVLPEERIGCAPHRTIPKVLPHLIIF